MSHDNDLIPDDMLEKTTFIPNEILERITGCKQPKRQCDALKEAGIFFIQRKCDGRPSVSWYHYKHPGNSRRLPDPNPSDRGYEPDFTSLQNQ
jgi:hypothetical protein